ncbi:MAG: DUF2807 domain-containing protein [Prevotellaceae bacterium]|jgi:phage shock protein PspC (stress-responsive transcriptional regulator)|nr:DUF2807 domain-containing protein [Prevotellaceae bacterium]
MKKTITVNLNNIVFTIDDDAYDLLKNYLNDITAHFASDPERDEIMNDIEARIAELFGERLSKSKHVINIADVQEIMGILGNPSQFVDGDSENAPADDGGNGEQSKKKDKRSRRFYRDPENAILGGVGGGLAAYLNLDVTVVRVILALMFFIFTLFGGGWLLIAVTYILLWIIAPQARSASQRLEMQGEEVTVENIKSEFNNFKNYIESDNFKQSTKSIGDRIVKIAATVLKIFGGFLAAVLSFAGFIVVASLFVALVLLIFNPGFVQGLFHPFAADCFLSSPEKPALLFVSLLLVVGCPVFSIVYCIVKLVSGKGNTSGSAFLVVLLLWLAGLFMLVSVSSKIIVDFKNLNGESWEISCNGGNLADELRTCKPFHAIHVSGNIELKLKQDSVREVLISTYAELLPKITTEVKEGVLHISSTAISLKKPVVLNVTVDSISSIVAQGACDVKTLSRLGTPADLKITLYGAAKADLETDVAGTIDMDLKGASKIDLEGRANILKINAAGASKISAKELKAPDVFISLSGASDAEIYASESIDVKAVGASKIKCAGNPSKVVQSVGIASSFEMN